MDTSLLDMLHDATHVHGLGVTDRVDVDLDRTLKEAVEQYGVVRRDAHGLGHVALEIVLVVRDHHAASAQHVTGTHEERESDATSDLDGLFERVGGACGRIRDPQFVEYCREELAVLGQVDRLGARAHDRHARVFERMCELEWSLPAEGHDDALGLLGSDDVHDVLEGERLEIESITRIVVGGDRLRVAVDHDRLVTHLSQRIGTVHAAVVELDTLPDAVRSGAKDHCTRLCGRSDLVLILVRLVVVRRTSRELSRTGVDRLERGLNTQVEPCLPDIRLSCIGQMCDLDV